jgi:glycerol-3-phosphate dehydrogenase (NAD+)
MQKIPEDSRKLSLDSVIPENIDQSSTIPLSELRNSLWKLCAVLGIEWNERLGEYFVEKVLERYDLNRDGKIQVDELIAFVRDMKSAPRRLTRNPKRILVLGGGAFGTGMACAFARKGHFVRICFLDSEQKFCSGLNREHLNRMCFPEVLLSENITGITTSELLRNSKEFDFDLVVHAIPVQYSFKYLRMIRAALPKSVPILSTSKGISVDTLEFMNEIIEKALGEEFPTLFIAGPSFAQGLVDGDPTIVTLASKDQKLAQQIQMMISTPDFRVYTSTDVIGLEVSGALKNVLAIASGIAHGLGYGPNSQASLITRGWRDIKSLVNAMGGNSETLLGLAGLGDLMMTCYGGLSRNTKFGRLIASGKSCEEAKSIVGQVVEGYPTANAACRLAKKLNVDVPVLSAINDVLHGKLSARDMVTFIMCLPLASEFNNKNLATRSINSHL